MKKIIIASLIVILSGANVSFAQDHSSKKVHELGLTFSSLNNFGMTYKCGNEKTLFRLTALYLNANSIWGENQSKLSGVGTSIKFGFEKRINVVTNFNLFIGSDFGISFSYNKNDGGGAITKQWGVSPGISFVFGVGYHIGKNFIVSAEIAPTLMYVYEKEKISSDAGIITTSTHNNIIFGLTNNNASITIAYRFSK